MKRLLCYLLFAILPATAFAFERVGPKKIDGSDSGYAGMAAPTGATAGCVGVFLGSPLNLQCAPAYGMVYNTTTKSLDVTDGRVQAGNLKAIGLGTPGAITVTNQGTPGTTTVTYTLLACYADGSCTEAGANSTTTTSAATLSGTDFNRLTWSSVSGSALYKVRREVSPTSPATTGVIWSGTALTVDDTGLAGDGTAKPTVDGTGVVTADSFAFTGDLALKEQKITFEQPLNGNRALFDVSFPTDTATANYGLQLEDFANPYGTRINHVAALGFNPVGAKATEPSWVTSMESRFDPGAATSMAEYHLAYTAPANAYGYRLFSFSVNSVDDRADGYFQTDTLSVRGTDDTPYFMFTTIGSPFFGIYGGAQIISDTNNTPLLVQKNQAGTGTIEAVRVDATDAVLLAGAGGVTRFGGPASTLTSTASGADGAVAWGNASVASGRASVAEGSEAKARLNGQYAHASWSKASHAGTSQYSRVNVIGTGDTAAEIELKIAEAWRVTLEAGHSYIVTVSVITTDYADTSVVAAFRGTFAATRTAAASTTRLNGATSDVTLAEIYSNLATTTAIARPDTTNGSVNVVVTPPAGNTRLLMSTATIEWTEVAY